MSKHFSLTAIALLFLAACHEPSRDNRDRPATGANATTGVDTTSRSNAYTADVDLNGDEKTFLTIVSSTNLYAAELSTLANLQTRNPKVKAIAAAIAADMKKANSDLHQIAKSKGLLLDDVLSDQQAKQLESLKKLKNKVFDRQYLTTMTESYTNVIQQLNKSNKFKDKNLVYFTTQVMAGVTARYAEISKLAQTAANQGANSGNDVPNAGQPNR